MIIVAAVVVLALIQYSELLRIGYEEVSLAISPDATRAMSFGDQHFSSKLPGSYNIDAADHFYRVVAKLNPDTPYLYHQFARIAFLRGKYGSAMIAIDKQIAKTGDSFPNAYYMRGLIEGFNGDYSHSESDYRTYLAHDPTNWAATNDLAWVLLRDDKPQEALDAIDKVFRHWQNNPWLLNSRATALRELGRNAEALVAIQAASHEVAKVSPSDWLLAYPGNDPMIAENGLESLKGAIAANLSMLESGDRQKR